MKIHKYIKVKYPRFYTMALVRVLIPMAMIVSGTTLMSVATIFPIFASGMALAFLGCFWVGLCFYVDIDGNLYKIWEDYAKWERKS